MTYELVPIAGCEVCGGQALVPVLDLGQHPMCDDLVGIGEPRVCEEFPIEILFCEACRTAHQRFQVPKAALFPRSYHYRSRFTADVLNGMAGLVEAVEQQLGSLAGRRVLDIGCNDGSLLDIFRAKGAVTVGIEPTGAATDAQGKGHRIYNAFLTESVAEEVVATEGRPDVITFTNVFAHIEDLPALIRSLVILSGPRTMVVIENHYLGAVLDGNQFDTFYHEHPRTYSYTSFVHIARALGMEVIAAEFPSRYGGNIRVFLGPTGSGTSELDRREIQTREAGFGSRFSELQGNLEAWRRRKGALISDLVNRHGPLRGKAFPGRAAILVRLLGLDQRQILAVHEKPGSMKIGHYLPGTRIPIVSDDELFSNGDPSAPLLNLAWHIPAEIRAYLTRHGCTMDVIDIVSADDFGPQP